MMWLIIIYMFLLISRIKACHVFLVETFRFGESFAGVCNGKRAVIVSGQA